MSLLPTHKILNADITHASFAQVVDTVVALGKEHRSAYVCVANVHMVVEGMLSPEFNDIMNEADIATPDGKPLSVFMNRLYGTQQERVAGMDLITALFEQCAQHHISVFFYGSTEDVLATMREKLQKEFPTLNIAGMISPPFRKLSEVEQQADIEQINASGAGVVMVALGCPKQERWMAEHRGKINAVMLGLGGAFPVYAGVVSRSPAWMQKYCLEWLYRLLMEPRRLFKRYLVTNSLFLYWMGLQMLGRISPKSRTQVS